MENEILYRNGMFWVCRATFGTGRFRPKTQGFKVFQDTVTHAVCVAQIGFDGDVGLTKAKEHCDLQASRYDLEGRGKRQ